MMGPTHRWLGALCGAVYAASTGGDSTTVPLTALVASVSAYGALSPDVDTTQAWTKVERRMPWVLGLLMSHRHITHWWFWPVLAWWWVAGAAPAEHRATLTALVIGWVSHLIGDAIFGKIPLAPWGGVWIGLDRKTDGFLESGKMPVFGRERRVIPFGPTKLAIIVVLAWFLFSPAPFAAPSVIAGG